MFYFHQVSILGIKHIILPDHNKKDLEDIPDHIKKDLNFIIDNGLKVSQKNIVFERNYWKISGTHDGYLQKFGTNHAREIEFYPEQIKFHCWAKISD